MRGVRVLYLLLTSLGSVLHAQLISAQNGWLGLGINVPELECSEEGDWLFSLAALEQALKLRVFCCTLTKWRTACLE